MCSGVKEVNGTFYGRSDKRSVGKKKEERNWHGGKSVQKFGRETCVGSDHFGHLHVEETVTLNMSQKNRNTINWVISLSHGGFLWVYFYALKEERKFSLHQNRL